MRGLHVVIGAGVVGLSLARRWALEGREVVVLEAADAVGTGVTSRNSEVLHAGIYYPPGSLKAQTCVAGRARLVRYCEARGVPYRLTGKLIVATDPEQVATLSALKANAEASGAQGLTWLTAREAQALEPHLACVAALHSPHSGIVDSHRLTQALAVDTESAGGVIVLRTPVVGLVSEGPQVRVRVGGSAPTELIARTVAIAAGHGALALARQVLPQAVVPPTPTQFAKGTYYRVVGCPPPFSRLVYPVPEPGGLGIHATVDLAGQVRFGPDVEWVDTLDHRPSDHRAAAFADAVRRYWPGVDAAGLAPTYAGVRPKITGPGEPSADFCVLGPADHGVPGVVALLGIESPGLTAAMALAEHATGVAG